LYVVVYGFVLCMNVEAHMCGVVRVLRLVSCDHTRL